MHPLKCLSFLPSLVWCLRSKILVAWLFENVGRVFGDKVDVLPRENVVRVQIGLESFHFFLFGVVVAVLVVRELVLHFWWDVDFFFDVVQLLNIKFNMTLFLIPNFYTQVTMAKIPTHFGSDA